MEGMIILLTILTSVFIGYKYGQMSNSKSVKSVSKGRTIVVDRTSVDTSKEDEIKEKFGDLD